MLSVDERGSTRAGRIAPRCCRGGHHHRLLQRTVFLSAAVFYPATRSPQDSLAGIYCDGGITGLNNPATFGVSLAHRTADAQGRSIDVISFGSGETTSEHEYRDVARRSAMSLALGTIDALMNSSAELMDRFYTAFGDSLGVRRYLRTNQLRQASSKLDDVAAIPKLITHFDNGDVYYSLFLAEHGRVLSTQKETATAESLRSVWTDVFDLPAVSEPRAISSIAQPVVVPAQRDSRAAAAAAEVLPTFRATLIVLLTAVGVAAYVVLTGSTTYLWREANRQATAAEMQRAAAYAARDSAQKLGHALLRTQIEQTQLPVVLLSDLLIPPLPDGFPYDDKQWVSDYRKQFRELFPLHGGRSPATVAAAPPKRQFDEYEQSIRRQTMMIQQAIPDLSDSEISRGVDNSGEATGAESPGESSADGAGSSLSIVVSLRLLPRLEQLAAMVSAWAAAGPPPDEVQELARDAVGQLRADWEQVRTELNRSGPDLETSDEFLRRRRAAYQSAAEVVETLMFCDERDLFQEGRAAREAYASFWRHYYGYLLLVESDDVARRMVRLGRLLSGVPSASSDSPPWTESGSRPLRFVNDAEALVEILRSAP